MKNTKKQMEIFGFFASGSTKPLYFLGVFEFLIKTKNP